MSRRCRQESFATIVERARASHPDFNITTDIIVGFPGETDQEWQESLAYIRQIGFGHVHCFSYSDREGTKASRLANKVPADIKKQRMTELLALTEEMRLTHLQQQLGHQVPVLWESGKEALGNGLWRFQGYTPNFSKISTDTRQDLSGELLTTDVHSISRDGKQLVGSISEQLLTNLRPPIALKTL
jgi:threonylcarbamoyladenosine tRNA methylthiotransferase MtaB